jgi:hypothetical protein
LERWDLSTLLTAKYSMVFFFRPLYTVFDPHHTKSHNMPGKQRNDQKSLALELNPSRSQRIQGGRDGEAEPKPLGAGGCAEKEGSLTECLPWPMAS